MTLYQSSWQTDGAEPPANSPKLELFTETGHIRRLRDIENDILAIAMRHYNGRTTQVAQALGIARSTLYRNLSDFQIDWAGAECPRQRGKIADH